LAIVLPGAGVTEGGDGPLAKPSARVALDAITALDTEGLYVYGFSRSGGHGAGESTRRHCLPLCDIKIKP
jgi:hypothetical protein